MTSAADPSRLLVLVLVLVVLSPVAAATSHDVRVESVSYVGDGDVSTPRERLLLWQSEPHAFEAVIASGNASGPHDVCLLTRPPDAGAAIELACRTTTLEADGQATVALELDRWPANATGRQNASVVVIDPNGSPATPLANESIGLTVLRKSGDPDDDGLPNEQEAAEGTDFFAADTDGDGLNDAAEVNTYATDPIEADTDGDGLVDGVEASDHQTDPTVADTDADGLTDDLEVGTHGTNPNRADTDGDGLDDAAEVNTYATDPTEADTDGDGLGDATEVDTHETNPNRADTDQDGLADGEEVTVYGTNPSKSDTDGDGLPDRAEVSIRQTDPTEADTDGDGLDDGAEVGTHGTNPNRADTDGDGRDDGDEIAAGTNPVQPNATPSTVDALLERRDVVGALVVGAGVALLVAAVLARRYRVPGSGARWLDSLRDRVALAGGESASIETDVGHPPLPTNRGRVFELLEERGGRMLQSDIVEETDWSKSKVSRVLSDMDEDGEIAKIDVGKGNLIALPEVAPPASRPRSDRDDE